LISRLAGVRYGGSAVHRAVSAAASCAQTPIVTTSAPRSARLRRSIATDLTTVLGFLQELRRLRPNISLRSGERFERCPVSSNARLGASRLGFASRRENPWFTRGPSPCGCSRGSGVGGAG